MKILVIEKDKAQVGKIESFFNTEGYRFELYTSPAPAQASIAAYFYNAIIFNLTSFGQDELDLLKFLRSSRLDKKTILTFEQDNIVNQNKVDALNMANLQKPYTFQALLTKINAVFNYENSDENQAIFFNELVIDVPGRIVRFRNQEINLTRLEYDLLLYFVMNRSKVLSKNTLAQYLTNDTAAEVSDFGFLYAHIKNLKKKLKAAGCNEYIKTVYGIGYRFQP